MPTTPQIYLAPIQGMTTNLYLRLYQQWFPGVDLFFAPFIKIHKDTSPLKKQKSDRLPGFDPALPLIPQLLSNDADEFPAFDRILAPLGYKEFNWNLGCPVPMVIHKKRGSGLLAHADRIQGILEQALPQLQCRLSVKVRLGYDQADELLALMPIFNRFPLKEIIIHPRLGRQMYQGQVDIPAFAECLAVSKNPVVYNGDIFNAQTFARLQSRFPQISCWMLGRGILANPFLPAQIKGLALPGDRLAHFQKFHDHFVQAYAQTLFGPAHFLDKLKESWSYWHLLFRGSERFFHQLLKLKKTDDYHVLVARFFSSQPEILENLEVCSEDFE